MGTEVCTDTKITATHTSPQEPEEQNKGQNGSVQSPFLQANFNSQQVLKQATVAEIPGWQPLRAFSGSTICTIKIPVLSSAFCDLYKKFTHVHSA